LEMHSQEVYNMLYGDWNMEEALDVRYEEGEARGRSEGHEEVLDLMAQGYDREQIKDILKHSDRR